MEDYEKMHSINSEDFLNCGSLNSIDNKSIVNKSSANRVLQNQCGRRPWYDSKGKMKEAYIIGLCGGSASGKTTVARNITERINVPWVVTLNLDSFYKVLTPEQHEESNRMEYDFDHPDAIDFNLAIKILKNMKIGKTVKIPIYDFTTHTRLKNKSSVVYGANVIIVEGLMTFYPKELLDILDFKIFVETDSDLRLCRRVKRDMEERDRELSSILLQYTKFVKPNFDKYISSLVELADIVIPCNTYNESAIDMIARLIERNLENRGFIIRSELISNYQESSVKMDEKICLIEQTKQVKTLQTIIRDSKTDRLSFCHHSHRLIKLCLVKALSLIDFEICFVSIMRAGECFEDVTKILLIDYCVGKILIQTNKETAEPEFHYLRLPSNISSCNVLLFDASISTGASALMAIRILIDHDVNEENVIMISLLLTPTGIQSILNAFPKVQIVSAAVDNKINSDYHIIPGFGNFGQRYYGV
ncbi:hypothetical protein MXB_3977 [Myxobolus squamalis]|nr:hypothetical protein MXB_3977 [Myxobolus squamalis]